MSGAWTGDVPLPGGDFDGDVPALAEAIRQTYPALAPATALRIARGYGTEAWDWLRPDLGRDFGAGLSEAEVDWLMDREWARTAEDVLWRRSKLGLQLRREKAMDLADWMKERPKATA